MKQESPALGMGSVKTNGRAYVSMNIGTIEDIMNDAKNGVTNFCKDGKCTECGNCCSRYLAMSNKEINTIRQYIKKHNIKQQKHAIHIYAIPLMDATCPFLDDTRPTHKCLIYEVRPLICREFKCDTWDSIDTTSPLFRSKLHPCDVTEIFFGKEQVEL